MLRVFENIELSGRIYLDKKERNKRRDKIA
jgi:hypothetical protein